MTAPGRLATFASVTRLHIVCIAALGTFTFGWLFTGRYPWLLAGVCAFVVAFVPPYLALLAPKRAVTPRRRPDLPGPTR